MQRASASNRRHLDKNPTCQGAVLVDPGRGVEQGTGDWESRDFGEPC